jgi:hypothetical protein
MWTLHESYVRSEIIGGALMNSGHKTSREGVSIPHRSTIKI